jgi:hypothetical protein
MKKILLSASMMFLLASSLCARDGFYYVSEDMIDPRAASYSFIGYFYSPLPVLEKGDKNPKTMDPKYLDVHPDAKRMEELPQALAKMAANLKLDLVPLAPDPAREASVGKDLLDDLKLDPKTVAALSAGKPYVLAAVIDLYADLRGALNIEVREKEDGQPIDYLGRRSRLQLADLGNAEIGHRRTACMTLVAFDAKDGHVVWQANEAKTTQKNPFTDQKGCAKDVQEDIFKRLQNRWKKLQKEMEKKKGAER